MKNRRKILLFIVFIIGVVGGILFFTNQKRGLTIDEILKTDAYNYLSDNVKDFIKEHYEETGELYLTEKNFEGNEAYLNPSYIEYLDSNNKDSYNIIPSVTAYVPKLMTINDSLPSKFDLRDVNGKNYVTPNKNQGTEGLCWAYATASLLETHDLIVKDKSYDSTAVLFSEKQMDYALSSNGIIGGNKISNLNRTLASGAALKRPEKLLAERLGGFSDSWNIDNNEKIKNNEPLEPNVVFNRDLALYEIDETVRYSNINSDYTDTESMENMTKIIKNIIYNYGGATINIKSSSSNYIRNILGGGNLAITSKQYFTASTSQHALHLIGWDDDYDYGFCVGDIYGSMVSDAVHYENDELVCNTHGGDGHDYPFSKVTGKGAWILKNSWGNDRSYVYLPYDSFIDDIFSITKYSEKNWDDSSNLNKELYFNYSKSKYEKKWSLDNDLFDEDTIIKIKLNIDSPQDISLYFSEDGNDDNLTLIDNYSFDSAGVKTIDLQTKNLHINEHSFFITDNYVNDLTLFTIKRDNNVKAFTYNFTFNLEDDFPTNGKFMNIAIKTKLKNINDNELINYKIKYKNGDYLPENAYSITINKSYYSMATPIIKISEQYAKKGEYVLETWKNDSLLYSSSIDIKIDYMSIDGDGTNDNPWQITNTRQFNMIKKALNDNYILVNDLDFEYDTKNENGLFYNSGTGWNAIDDFKGNFNGNDKVIRNIKTSTGLFHRMFVFNSSCKFDICGIHDLKVDNLEYIVRQYGQTSGNGGVINHATVISYKYKFNNLSVTNANFIYDENVMFWSNIDVKIGGIFGSLDVHQNSSFERSIVKLDNLYSNYTLSMTGRNNYKTTNYIGGLIGQVQLYSTPYLYINNAKVNASININNDNDTMVYVSDLIGHYNNDAAPTFLINNTIANVDYQYNDNSRIKDNAFIGKTESSVQGIVKINGARTTFDYTPNAVMTLTNSLTSIKPYEIARSNYSGIEYYESQYYCYDQFYSDTSRVSFEDKFNHIENTIPTLKQFPEEYAEYAKTYSLKVGETKSVNDLIIKDSNNKKLNVYSEFVCDLELCNNVTDSTIISIPTIQNEYQFTGLKSGSTKLILYDEYSGYLDTVIINVMNDDDYHLILDYNYDNIIDDSHILTNGNTYGSLPNPNRTGYEFIGWFTERENGIKIEENTIFNDNNDVTLYAHWQINSYTVTFNSNGGSNVTNQTIDYNGKVTKPSNPTREGYTFKEWQLNGNTYDFNTPVTENITLTAVWEETEKDTLKDILEDNNYTVNNGFVSKFTVGTSITDLQSELGNDVTIETDKEVIATGAVIRKGNESYIVVIKGDLTGDGKVNSGDLLQMRKYLLEEVNLTGAYKEAGIIESIGNIKSLDLLRLRQFLLGEYTFN